MAYAFVTHEMEDAGQVRIFGPYETLAEARADVEGATCIAYYDAELGEATGKLKLRVGRMERIQDHAFEIVRLQKPAHYK